MTCEAITGCVIESSTFGIKARLVDIDDVAYQQADITAITWSCWDASDTKVIDAASLVVSNVISDTLLTTGWDIDAIGYNFVHAINDDVCVSSGVHTIQYTVALASGQSFITRQFHPDVQAAKS